MSEQKLRSQTQAQATDGSADARTFPNGFCWGVAVASYQIEGAWNEDGVDELLVAGIEPFATLYYWNLPQTPQDRYGGWQSPETSIAFGEYAYWSSMDNFERTDGYGTRFGLVYADCETQKRTPKLSAAWFREAARQNAVV
jgi:beta-glucosidase/6-phospho-beta-glucosidase/beta-galactosidase